MTKSPPMPPEVAAIYAQFAPEAQRHLKALRTLIYHEAASNPAIGPLTETLKWREPSYLTDASKSGTTIRLAWKAKDPERSRLLVSCQTTLVSDWKDLYHGLLSFEGARAIVFNHGQPYDVDAVRHCVAMALTYHLRKTRDS